jgi:outer membrane murein-binding lipoprotein Lpp
VWPPGRTIEKKKEKDMPRSVRQLLVAVAAVIALAGSAAAQDMTTSDVQRLQTTADQIGSDILKLRQSDRAAARTMQAELDELEDEIIYLKVKLRRERNVSRADYMDVRDRLETLRSRVSGNDTYSGRYGTGSGSSTSSSTAAPGVIPSGTEIDVRLETALSSDTNQVEDRFEATTIVDLRQDGRVVIPAGSRVRGVVTAVDDAGRIERKGRLSLSFDQVTINGRNYPIRGTVTQALEAGGYKDDAGKIGTGAAVGGIIGGILGGLKGAIAGILIGGGGVVAATEGENVELPAGTVLRMRLDQDLNTRNLTRQ